MSFKSWILDRLQIVGGAVTRADLGDPPARGEPALVASERISNGYVARPEPSLDEVLHLGTYGPLVIAIREELEHFVASHVRLHLAIADRDRFLLTAIAVSRNRSRSAIARCRRTWLATKCSSSSRIAITSGP